MLLFLVLNIGSIFYAVYISVFQWNIRSGAGKLDRAPELRRRALATRPSTRAIENSVYYAVVWVPLTMAVGLFLAVLVNQKLRGRTFFRAAYYFPAIASSAAITILWIFLAAPDGFFNQVRAALGLNGLFDAVRLSAQPELDRRRGHGPELRDPAQRLDDLGHVHALLPGLAPDDQQRGLRGGRDRRRGHLADVLEDHVPAAPSRPLLRGDGRGHRGAAAVRPGRDRRRSERRPRNALMTVVLYLYNQAFTKFDFDYAAAVGLILFAIIFTITLIQRRVFGSAPAW